MIIVVGLGNPGEKYRETRHNTGFMVLDQLAKICSLQKGDFSYQKKLMAKTCLLKNGLLLVKPQTFMNESGVAVEKTVKFYDKGNTDRKEKIWVVHDDMDLELGRLKIEKGGTSGHHGLESIIKHLGSGSYLRFRVGVGRPDKTAEDFCSYQSNKDYLLSDFSLDQKERLQTVLKTTVEAVLFALNNNVDTVMNKYN